jgi:hypothetical protein
MNRLHFAIALCAFGFVVSGCATSMTPSQFNEALPKATKSQFYGRVAANEAVTSGKCQILVGGRKYTSPIGLTVQEDLKNGAVGIDEWVKADGGNAYSVANFEWISVGDQGATQLVVHFDTMSCK